MTKGSQTVARIQTTRSAGRFHLAGELARGLGASRRPSGGVRFTGSPAKYRAHHSNRRPAYPCLHRETATKQSTTKVSTLSQDLTACLGVHSTGSDPRSPVVGIHRRRRVEVQGECVTDSRHDRNETFRLQKRSLQLLPIRKILGINLSLCKRLPNPALIHKLMCLKFLQCNHLQHNTRRMQHSNRIGFRN